MRRRNLSLALRTAGVWLLLAAVLALGASALLAPRWIMESRLRTAMRADGLTGRGELLWQGQVPSLFGTAYMTVVEEDGQLYAGRLETYEGRPYVTVLQGEEAETYRKSGGAG